MPELLQSKLLDKTPREALTTMASTNSRRTASTSGAIKLPDPVPELPHQSTEIFDPIPRLFASSKPHKEPPPALNDGLEASLNVLAGETQPQVPKALPDAGGESGVLATDKKTQKNEQDAQRDNHTETQKNSKGRSKASSSKKEAADDELPAADQAFLKRCVAAITLWGFFGGLLNKKANK